jgi:hypothetical protein
MLVVVIFAELGNRSHTVGAANARTSPSPSLVVVVVVVVVSQLSSAQL